MQLTRRRFLKSSGCGVLALALPPALARRARAGGAAGNVLVVVFLRGGADALSLAIPSGDPFYARIRPGIAVDPVAALPLRSSYARLANRGPRMERFFRLNPECGGLKRRFDAGELAIVHACGDAGSYSHAGAQAAMERADPGHPATAPGWLHRALAQLADPSALAGVALSSTSIASLDGPDPTRVTALPSLSDFALDEPATGDHRRLLEAMYSPSRLAGGNATARHALGLLGGSTAELFDLLDAIGAAGLSRLRKGLAGTPYEDVENRGWAHALRDAAALIKADGGGAGLGVRAIALDFRGWDHHRDLLVQTSQSARELSQVLDAFMSDLGVDADRTLVLCMTEFGRTAFENGSAGADHGFGSLMLALCGRGGRMSGRRVLCRATGYGGDAIGWPGLGPGSLHRGQPPKAHPDIERTLLADYAPEERDLAVTIDFRDVMADVLQEHLGLAPDQIAGHRSRPLGSYTPAPLPDGGLFALRETA